MRKSYVYQCGLGRDAPATGCSHTRALSWLGHACSGKQMISNVNVAIELFGNGCSGNRMFQTGT